MNNIFYIIGVVVVVLFISDALKDQAATILA